jgi:hypothetical protein
MDRFSPEPNTGCWLWTGYIDRDGYGLITFMGKTRRAHRLTYELLTASIPDGLTIDHLCRERSCVNPDHLEPVSQGVNVMRGDTLPAKQARQTHCFRGHEFTKDNLMIVRGKRICRICDRAKSLRRYHALKHQENN